MAKISSLFAGVSLAVLSVASAFAADLPSRRAPAPYLAPPPVFTWSGFYIGLNAGASFRVNNNNNNNNAFLFAGVNPFLFGNNNNNNQVGFVGGGQIGYNWQTGPIVFGLEADAQYRSNIGNNNNNNFFGGGGNNNNGGFYGTARGRLGYAITPMFMIYATGGAAFGNVGSNAAVNPFFLGVGNNNGSSFRVGYAVGGGLEYAFTPNWSIKAEALYNEIRSNQGGGGFGFGNNNNRNSFVVARLGVNYKFNLFGAPAPVVARY